MVATGPRPGSTPISVPRMQPPNAYSRFWNVNATPKPSARLLSRSMVSSSAAEHRGPQRNRQLQAVQEDDPAADRQDDRVDERILPVELVTRVGGDDDEDRNADDHAQVRQRPA